MINSDFHIVNLSAYQTPEIVENPNEEFISYGEDNDYYQELIDAYLNSPTTGSIINGISNQIYGKGVNAHNASKKPDEYAQMKSLFKKKCLQKVAMDLKLLGEAAFQVIYKGKKIVSVSHFNRETLRAEKCDDKGKINAYYYHPNWSEYQNPDELTRIPIFGSGANNEIYIIRKFIPSMHYYSPPDWANALNYSKLECEISEYLVNEVQNSFSGTKLVSFSNGVPTQEKQHLIKNEIMNKLTGANGEKVIISFSDSAETKTQIEDISVSDAADVYSYIAEECSRKLLLANRITSPLLVGIRDTGNSLGSNAEEIENAHNLFDNVVIKPYQELILNAIDDILSVNAIALDLFFETLTPIEFVDTEEIINKEQKEEETGQIIEDQAPAVDQVVDDSDEDLIDKQASYNGAQIASALSILQNVKEGIITEDQAIVFLVQMLQFDIDVARSMFSGNGSQELFSKIEQKNKDQRPELSKDHEALILKNLENFGEDLDDEWELIEQSDVVDGKEEQVLSKLEMFADTAEAKDKSKEDKGLYKLRYKYDGNPNPERAFCKAMMSRNKGKKYGLLYRLEDIKELSDLNPNKGLGKGGANNYDIFKYLGGVNCKHFFKRMIFFRKRNSQGNFLPASDSDNLENDKRVANVPGLKRKGIEGTPPNNRPNKGRA